MQLQALYETFLLDRQAMNCSDRTLTSYHEYWQRFSAFLELKGIEPVHETLTKDVFRQFLIYMRQQHYADQTITNTLKGIKAIFNFAVAEELIPARSVKLPRDPKVPMRAYTVFSKDDIRKLLGACDKSDLLGMRNYCILLTLYDTGVRATELVGLRIADVDWDRHLLHVFGKGRKAREVPIDLTTLQVIRKYLSMRRRLGVNRSDDSPLFLNRRGGSLSRSGLAQMLRKLEVPTGLHSHAHKFRHTFAITALRNDANLFDVQDCLGHTTLMMTKRYARQSSDELAKRHQKFSPVRHLYDL